MSILILYLIILVVLAPVLYGYSRLAKDRFPLLSYILWPIPWVAFVGLCLVTLYVELVASYLKAKR